MHDKTHQTVGLYKDIIVPDPEDIARQASETLLAMMMNMQDDDQLIIERRKELIGRGWTVTRKKKEQDGD